MTAALRPFWRYYGGKWRAAPRYPAPRYDTIVEPFAGAAGYSLRYPDRQVVLIERDPMVAETWRWLIGASRADVLAVPLVDDARDLPGGTPAGAFNLVRLLSSNACHSVGYALSAGMKRDRERGGKTSGWSEAMRERVAAQVERIKHWRVIEGDYTQAPDVEATWFIDPPYDNRAGRAYKFHDIDYPALGEWCRTRRGQVIACENDGATWLPFRPLYSVTTRINGAKGEGGRTSTEAIWTNDDTPSETKGDDMPARIAFDGEPTDRTCREACAAARAQHGDFVALVVAGSRCAASVAQHAAVSAYTPDEQRDADVAVAFAADGTWTLSEQVSEHTTTHLFHAEEHSMQATQTHQFLWLDLETTGLDPASGVPLEFAAVLCEDARGDDFRVVQSFTSAIHHEVDALDALRIDRTVLDMHAANGLWKDVQLASVSVADVDAFLAALAADLTGGRERAVRLAGSSVHFDLAWCRVHFPTFARYLSHRVLDVTTLRAAVDVWAPAPVEWPRRDAHRALDDVLASIAEARVARAALFGGGK